MSKDSKPKNNFLLYYQCAVASGAVLVFFTFLDSYLFDSGITPPPVVLIVALGGAGFLLLILCKFSLINYIPVNLITWCTVYVAISLMSFLLSLSGEAAFQELRNRILSSFFLLLVSLICSKYTTVQNWTRGAICLAGLLAVFNNIYELMDSSAFGVLNDTGRAAGYYINPNRTGCALILSLIFGVGVLPPKNRIFFAVIIIFGVLVTFSRGAILGWILVMGIFLNAGLIPRKQLLYWILGLAVIIFVLGPALGSLLDIDELERSGLIKANFKDIRERLAWFENPSGNSDDSADARLEVAKIAWNMFLEHPILGNGIASTKELTIGISTHNMYLYFMADHGILGTFIMPLLVYAVTWKARGESKYIGLAFAGFILLWGLFSHNIVEERYILISFSLMSAMNLTSRLESKSKT